MSPFSYENGELRCEGVSAGELAREFGTPLYVYSRRHIEEQVQGFRDAFSWGDALICFSVKALSNIHILKVVCEAGCGFDIVSGGELHRVTEAVGDTSRVVFAGVGKTAGEITAALTSDIFMFNVESEAELEAIDRAALSQGRKARVGLRFNPDVDPHTHEYTTTGKKENKFGLSADRIRRIAGGAGGLKGATLSAIHVHMISPE